MSEGTCSVEGCDQPIKSRGWCRKHYLRWYRTGQVDLLGGRWATYTRPTCSVDGCDRVAHGRGLCTVHGPRMCRHGDPLAGRRENSTGSDEERFLSFIEPDGECWHWTGGLTTAGYGIFHLPGGVSVYAHRWAYEHWVAPIPPDRPHVDHTFHTLDIDCAAGRCPHRACANPEHGEPVTPLENNRRARERSL